MRGYNTEHTYSRSRFVTPSERHRGLDHQILVLLRYPLYERARQNA
jgi:putative transposase